MTFIIAAERLSKRYGPRSALTDVSFAIAPGEVVGLLGPNGSGKSTLLRILTGYLAPTSGTARIDGLDLSDDSLAVRRRIGYVPEDAPLYDGMRAGEFLRFMACIKGLEGGARSRRAVEAAVGALHRDAVMDRPIARLSRGYRQRVAIAQALLGDPPVLVLDEPTNALDALAKYLASLSLILLMLLFSGSYAVVLGLFGEPDWGPIYSGYLGLLLLGAALVAMGLTASALVANQVVAALASLNLFLLLWIIDDFGRLLPDPFNALAVNLSLAVHFRPFATGSLYLSDAGNFLSLAMLGLFLSTRALGRR